MKAKAKIIQTSVWRFALYGMDMHFVGKAHFNRLRRGVINALVGHKPLANAFLALLFVIISACRCIRRLASISSDIARDIVRKASTFVGKVAFGPASSLARYLRLCGVSITPSGWLSFANRLICNVLQHSTKSISISSKGVWPDVICKHWVSRRGIDPLQSYDARGTQINFGKLDRRKQKLIVLNLIGGFQSNFVKKKWLRDIETTCELCGSEDTVLHRFTCCAALVESRSRHVEACTLISDDPNRWLYHPFCTFSPAQKGLTSILENMPPIHPDDRLLMHADVHVYFTDGGCLDPSDIHNRSSAWAVLRDVAPDQSTAEHYAEEAIQKRSPYPFWRCLGMGHTVGKQTISRAELQAITFALEAAVLDPDMRCVHVHTDSQYAIDTWNKLAIPGFLQNLYSVENADLVRQLAQLRARVSVIFFKVKSHQKYEDLQGRYARWQALGNNTVDAIATLALQKLPIAIRDEQKNL